MQGSTPIPVPPAPAASAGARRCARCNHALFPAARNCGHCGLKVKRAPRGVGKAFLLLCAGAVAFGAGWLTRQLLSSRVIDNSAQIRSLGDQLDVARSEAAVNERQLKEVTERDTQHAKEADALREQLAVVPTLARDMSAVLVDLRHQTAAAQAEATNAETERTSARKCQAQAEADRDAAAKKLADAEAARLAAVQSATQMQAERDAARQSAADADGAIAIARKSTADAEASAAGAIAAARKRAADADNAIRQVSLEMKSMRENLAAARGGRAASDAYTRFIAPTAASHVVPEIRERVLADTGRANAPSNSRAQWEALGNAVKRHESLTPEYVERQLGQPDRIYDAGPSVAVWSYTPHNFPGQVTFVRGLVQIVVVPRDVEP